MSNKLKKKKMSASQGRQDSVFREAWENMNEDLSRFMPGFMSKHMRKGKSRMMVMLVVTLLEVVVLAAAGKLVYDWFTK